jgi:hypothetical protein
MQPRRDANILAQRVSHGLHDLLFHHRNRRGQVQLGCQPIPLTWERWFVSAATSPHVVRDRVEAFAILCLLIVSIWNCF